MLHEDTIEDVERMREEARTAKDWRRVNELTLTIQWMKAVARWRALARRP